MLFDLHPLLSRFSLNTEVCQILVEGWLTLLSMHVAVFAVGLIVVVRCLLAVLWQLVFIVLVSTVY